MLRNNLFKCQSDLYLWLAGLVVELVSDRRQRDSFQHQAISSHADLPADHQRLHPARSAGQHAREIDPVRYFEHRPPSAAGCLPET